VSCQRSRFIGEISLDVAKSLRSPEGIAAPEAQRNPVAQDQSVVEKAHRFESASMGAGLMSQILVVGELNPDFILHGHQSFPVPGKEVLVNDFTVTLGSASAICAMGLSRLGDQVAFLSKVGEDIWGDFCLETLRGGGLNVSRVIRDPRVKTGVTVSISSSLDRALLTFLGSMVALEEPDISDQSLKDFRHLHVSSYYLQRGLRPGCRKLFARAHRLGMTTSLDPGYDPAETWGDDLLETLDQTDVFLPNEVEAEGLTGRSGAECLRALQNGRTLTVLKLGSKGCMTMERGQVIHFPAFAVVAVDTTGAGDSFNAGFLHAWLSAQPLLDCLKTGAACGALSTLALGGISAQPDAATLHRFLNTPLRQ
jgi:sugar/nucleoside kinase (ribokinase family)